MKKRPVKFPLRLFGYMLVGWLITSTMAIGYERLGDAPEELGFYMGLFGSIIGSIGGVLVYYQRHEIIDEKPPKK